MPTNPAGAASPAGFVCPLLWSTDIHDPIVTLELKTICSLRRFFCLSCSLSCSFPKSRTKSATAVFDTMNRGTVAVALASAAVVVAVENGLARTPQMGWVCPHACSQRIGFRTARLTSFITEQLEYVRMRCF